jgi:hypothetical protein
LWATDETCGWFFKPPQACICLCWPCYGLPWSGLWPPECYQKRDSESSNVVMMELRGLSPRLQCFHRIPRGSSFYITKWMPFKMAGTPLDCWLMWMCRAHLPNLTGDHLLIGVQVLEKPGLAVTWERWSHHTWTWDCREMWEIRHHGFSSFSSILTLLQNQRVLLLE